MVGRFYLMVYLRRSTDDLPLHSRSSNHNITTANYQIQRLAVSHFSMVRAIISTLVFALAVVVNATNDYRSARSSLTHPHARQAQPSPRPGTIMGRQAQASSFSSSTMARRAKSSSTPKFAARSSHARRHKLLQFPGYSQIGSDRLRPAEGHAHDGGDEVPSAGMGARDDGVISPSPKNYDAWSQLQHTRSIGHDDGATSSSRMMPHMKYEHPTPSEVPPASRHRRMPEQFRGPSHAEDQDNVPSNTSVGVHDTVTPGGGRQSGAHDWKRDDSELGGATDAERNEEDSRVPDAETLEDTHYARRDIRTGPHPDRKDYTHAADYHVKSNSSP
jgi:hypothetical protein